MLNKLKNALKGNKKQDENIQEEKEVSVEAGQVDEQSGEQEDTNAEQEVNENTQEASDTTDVEEATDDEVSENTPEQTDSDVEATDKEESDQDQAEEEVLEESEANETPASEGVYKVEKVEGRTLEEAGIPTNEYKIQDLISMTLKQFAPLIIKKGIRLELDGLDRKIETNEEVMLFIFQEIISNAVNSLIEGSIKIYVKDDMLVFEDTGYGIPADEVALVCNEGFMASNAAPSDDVEGMGMYKCAIALEKMNYGYEIRSTQDVGTTFSIQL